MNRMGQEKVLQYYGKHQLLKYAESFRDLSELYLKDITETDELSDQEEQKGEARIEILTRSQIKENEKRMSDRLVQLADRITRIANENVICSYPPKNKVKTLSHDLRSHCVDLKEVYFIDQNGGLEIAVTMKGQKNTDYTTDDVGERLSAIFEIPVTSSRDNLFFIAYEYDTYIYESKPAFEMEMGYAKAAKETESISGDSHTFYEQSEWNRYVLLSDGAGSGEKAREDSERVVDYMVRYLEAGFGLKEAASMVNSVFVSACREVNLPTLDACHVDLRTGAASFIKYGGVSSFIKSRHGLETVENSAFPLGLQSRSVTNCPCENYDLSAGELCIMISDGILECFKREEELKQIILRTSIRDPKALASAIMQYSVGMSRGKIKDDMTVLAFRLNKR